MRRLLHAACLASILLAAPAIGAGWRGDGTGRYPNAAPPTTWDTDDGTHVLWRAAVGKGQSTPVLAGDRILLTAEKDWLLGVDRKTGKILWKQDNSFAALPPEQAAKGKRWAASAGVGHSTPTPVTDGEHLYVNYATGIVACHTLDGARVWVRYIPDKQVLQYGRSASPRLVDGKLLVTLSGLLALDARTGRTLWHNRDARPAYGTPAVARIGGVDVAITPGGDCVRLADGKILATEIAQAKYSSPLVHEGVVYFAESPTVALRLPEKPEGPLAFKLLWENDDVEGGFFASPLCHEGILYCVANEGVLYALDAKTGETVFDHELDIPSAAGKPGTEPANLYPSLTLAGKHLLLANDAGDILVLAPGREYQEVAHNYLDAGSGASPVADGPHLFLRGGAQLYCIGAK